MSTNTLPNNISFIPTFLFETVRSFFFVCRVVGRGRLRFYVHMLQLWFCSHMSVFFRDQAIVFMKRNRVKITVSIDLPFIGDITAWIGYLFGLGPTNWVWRVKRGITRW